MIALSCVYYIQRARSTARLAGPPVLDSATLTCASQDIAATPHRRAKVNLSLAFHERSGVSERINSIVLIAKGCRVVFLWLCLHTVVYIIYLAY